MRRLYSVSRQQPWIGYKNVPIVCMEIVFSTMRNTVVLWPALMKGHITKSANFSSKTCTIFCTKLSHRDWEIFHYVLQRFSYACVALVSCSYSMIIFVVACAFSRALILIQTRSRRRRARCRWSYFQPIELPQIVFNPCRFSCNFHDPWNAQVCHLLFAQSITSPANLAFFSRCASECAGAV